MASNLEEFVQRLNEMLLNQCRHEYVRFGDLAASIRKAAWPEGPADTEYPRMLFLHGSRSETRVVHDASEEQAAQHEGYLRTPLPPPVPKFFVERPRSQGGTSYDLRRVTLFSPQEEQQLLAVVEKGSWIEDGVQNVHGARGVGLQELVKEYKESIKRLVDEEQLTLGSDSTAPAEATEEVR